jgi:hypothetical protein
MSESAVVAVRDRFDARVDALSDRISPLVVKEVRQFVRGRDFLTSFVIGLATAVLISFVGSIEAMGGSTTAGRSTFTTLTLCLSLLGLAVVPIGAFTTLRTERLEQTLDLISLTTISPRRIVIGKLLAQVLKLTTFFAAMAPFVATSFLLGGIDLVTILATLVMLFLWSVWVAAAAMLISTAFRTRVMSTVMLGLFALFVFLLYSMGRSLLLVLFGGIGGVYYASPYGGSPFGSPVSMWWTAGSLVLLCVTTLMNVVLLAESRLALPTEDRVPTLRAGFFAQFLVLVLWALALRWAGATNPFSLAGGFEVLGSLHLGLVAVFAVTAGLDPGRSGDAGAVPPRLRLLGAFLRSGAGSAAAYVAVQMAIFVAVGSFLRDWDTSETRRLIAICGAILFFTGMPTLLAHGGRRFGMGPLHARGIALLLLAASLILPDLLYYTFSGTDQPFTSAFSARHLFSPARIPFNWNWIERNGWEATAMMWALVGAVSYVALLRVRVGRQETSPEPHMTGLGLAAGAAGDGDRR